MCGIAGYILKAGTTEQSKIRAATAVLAVEMLERGHQSWGCYDGSAVSKGIGEITRGMKLPEEMPAMFMLHTRHATHGNITAENAHPFEMAQGEHSIVGIHNGIISNHTELNRKYGRKFEVDSQHIFQHLLEGKNALADLEGYGAIAYVRNGELWAGAFQSGELSIVTTPIGLFFASTRRAIEKALGLATIEIDGWYTVKQDHVYRLQPDGLFQGFDVSPQSTLWKWDDKQFANWPSDDFPSAKKGKRKKGKLLWCCECYEEIDSSLTFYRNLEDAAVCATCAVTKYAFVGEDDYALMDIDEWAEPLKCDLCEEPIQGNVYTVYEDGVDLCEGCFQGSYTTHGLTKIDPSLVQ